MKLALANRFKVLLLSLLVVAALAVVFTVTGKHGWIAFSAFIAAFVLVMKIGNNYGFHFPRQK